MNIILLFSLLNLNLNLTTIDSNNKLGETNVVQEKWVKLFDNNAPYAIFKTEEDRFISVLMSAIKYKIDEEYIKQIKENTSPL